MSGLASQQAFLVLFWKWPLDYLWSFCDRTFQIPILKNEKNKRKSLTWYQIRNAEFCPQILYQRLSLCERRKHVDQILCVVISVICLTDWIMSVGQADNRYFWEEISISPFQPIHFEIQSISAIYWWQLKPNYSVYFCIRADIVYYAIIDTPWEIYMNEKAESF